MRDLGVREILCVWILGIRGPEVCLESACPPWFIFWRGEFGIWSFRLALMYMKEPRVFLPGLSCSCEASRRYFTSTIFFTDENVPDCRRYRYMPVATVWPTLLRPSHVK